MPAGSRFCGRCGAGIAQVERRVLTDPARAMQRHAEHLSRWLEADVRRTSRLKPVLLGSILVPLLLAGAWVVFEESPAAETSAPAEVAEAVDRSAPTGGLNVDDAANGSTLVAANTDSTVTSPSPEPRLPTPAVRPSDVDRSAPATVTIKNARAVAPGVLQLLVTPWAYVSIDGRVRLRRARGADTLTAGVPHRLHFERPGFATKDASVTLRPGEERLLEIQMTPLTP